jgi:hypothetical protein
MVYRTFWFNAKSSATIALMDCLMRDADGVVDDLDPFYEINLCNNGRASIKKMHTDMPEESVDGSVCYDNDNWEVVTVAVIDGLRIVVSYGKVPNENVFLSFTDYEPLEVNYVAVKTEGFNGHWMMNKVPEEAEKPTELKPLET